ncbi:TPA: hypothetical protein ACGUM0_004518, partial [Vibrio vulnificus]
NDVKQDSFMTTSQNHKYTQLKWLYSALSGLCAAYFLALFSGGASLENSVFLQLATLCFSICLPVFTTFAFAHVYMYELDASVEVCDEALNQPWVNRITIGSFGCLVSAFIFLIGYFSITAMIGFIIVSALCVYCFIEFAAKLSSHRAES